MLASLSPEAVFCLSPVFAIYNVQETHTNAIEIGMEGNIGMEIIPKVGIVSMYCHVSMKTTLLWTSYLWYD